MVEANQAQNKYKNLKPFKSGKDWKGNSKGRPKGSRNRKKIVLEMLELPAIESIREKHYKVFGENLKYNTIAEQIAVSILAEALKGNLKAYKELFDSAYGKTIKINRTTRLIN